MMEKSLSPAANATLMQVADRLLTDHQSLMHGLDCHREWICQLCELGMPRFGELAERLRSFRCDLEQHFRAEENCSQLLHSATAQVPADQPNGGRLHGLLLERLTLLTERLRRGIDEFPSWNVAVAEVTSIIDEICEHERQEMDVLRQIRRQEHPQQIANTKSQ